ncbi:MAG: hypothetical protein M3Y71_19285, partial [Actinomycetota bacterium]|nr:hypothetical protein [Actinomycetota bacterium]
MAAEPTRRGLVGGAVGLGVLGLAAVSRTTRTSSPAATASAAADVLPSAPAVAHRRTRSAPTSGTATLHPASAPTIVGPTTLAPGPDPVPAARAGSAGS